MLNYKIKKIDNFLLNQDFKDLNEISSKIKENDKKDFDIYHNEVDSDGKIIKSTINKDLLIRIYKNYFLKAMSILEELYPEKTQLYDYSDFTIIISKKIVNFLFMMIRRINYYQE